MTNIKLVTSEAFAELERGYLKYYNSTPPSGLLEKILTLDIDGHIDYHKAQRILIEERGSKLIKHPLDYVKERWKQIKKVNHD